MLSLLTRQLEKEKLRRDFEESEKMKVDERQRRKKKIEICMFYLRIEIFREVAIKLPSAYGLVNCRRSCEWYEYQIFYSLAGPSWSYNYQCNQWLSPLTLWVRIPLMVRCTQYNIMWSSLSETCGRSNVFSMYSGFLHRQNWLQRYNWNIVESGIQHHNSNSLSVYSMNAYFCGFCCCHNTTKGIYSKKCY